MQEDSLVTLPANEKVMTDANKKAFDYDWTFFVGDLTKDVTRTEIFELFSSYGTVEDVSLKRPPTNNSMKYGFVAMSSEAELEKCVELDKKLTLHDKKLRLAHTRRNSRLVVSNLAATVTTDQLAAAFRVFGSLYEDDTRVGLQLELGGPGRQGSENFSACDKKGYDEIDTEGDAGVGGSGNNSYGSNSVKASNAACADDCSKASKEEGSCDKIRNSEGYHVGEVHFRERSCAVAAKHRLHGQRLGNKSVMFVDWAPSVRVSNPSSRNLAHNSHSYPSLTSGTSTVEGKERIGKKSESFNVWNMSNTAQGNRRPSDEEATLHSDSSRTAVVSVESTSNTANTSAVKSTSGDEGPQTSSSDAVNHTQGKFRNHRPKHNQGQSSYALQGGQWVEGSPILSLYIRFSTLKNVKIDEHILYTAFQRFGNVTAVTIKSKYLNKETMCFSGYAFVHYEVSLAGRASALAALSQMDNSVYVGVHYRVETSRNFAQIEAQCFPQAWQHSARPMVAPYTTSGVLPVGGYVQQYPVGNNCIFYGGNCGYSLGGINCDSSVMRYDGGDNWYQVYDPNDSCGVGIEGVPVVAPTDAGSQYGYIYSPYPAVGTMTGGMSPEEWAYHCGFMAMSSNLHSYARLGTCELGGITPGFYPLHQQYAHETNQAEEEKNDAEMKEENCMDDRKDSDHVEKVDEGNISQHRNVIDESCEQQLPDDSETGTVEDGDLIGDALRS